MRVVLHLLPLALLLLLPRPAPAQIRPVSSPSAMCDSAIASAEYAGRLPPHLLGAIARVESGRPDPRTGRLDPWPWTINAQGTGAFFPTKEDAIAAVQRLQARGVRSIDVGCLQINLMFHPNAFASLDEAFEPTANARYAARFLDELRTSTKDWMQAIGDYHSQTPVLGEDYRQRVMALWRDPDLSGWGLSLASAYQDFAPHRQAYADFAPASQAYGAFTITDPALAGPPKLRPGR
jgi:hypothetical protein